MNESKVKLSSLLGGKFHRNSHVYRFSSIPVIRRENVAEHSWYVALYSYIIAKDIESCTDRRVSYSTMLPRALLHDLDESMTGDFLRVVKYGCPALKKALDKLSSAAVVDIGESLGVDFLSDWSSAKDNDIEGDIVKLADLLRVSTYALEELRCGNSGMLAILKECNEYLQALLVDLKARGSVEVASYICPLILEIGNEVEEILHG